MGDPQRLRLLHAIVAGKTRALFYCTHLCKGRSAECLFAANVVRLRGHVFYAARGCIGRGVVAVGMNFAMADLNEYLAQVLEEQDKVLLSEASACLQSEARRAAYITVWLAIAESLRRKFGAAASYDHEAARIASDVGRMEQEHKAVDAFLVTKAKEYGLVSDAEATRLGHIYENRNIFGHPYEEEPSNQLVETAASEAVDIVLGQPLALRHGYLDRQVARLTGDLPFLNDDQETVEEYARSVHGRSAQDLRVWFVRKIVTALDMVFQDPTLDQLQRRGTWFLRAFLLGASDIFQEWDVVNDLPDHRQVLSLLLSDPALFAHLSDHAKDIVVNTLLQEAAATPHLIQRVLLLDEAGVLRSVNQQALQRTIAEAPLSHLRNSEFPLSAYSFRIIQLLQSHSWDPQNEAVRAVSSAGPEEVAELEGPVQEELGRNILQAADGRAFSAINFLAGLAGQGGWPPAFVRGIALEPFVNEDGELRLKPDRIVVAVRAALTLDEAQSNDVIDEIIRSVEGVTPEEPAWFRYAARDSVTALREAAGHPGRERMNEIADAIEAATAKLPEEDA